MQFNRNSGKNNCGTNNKAAIRRRRRVPSLLYRKMQFSIQNTDLKVESQAFYRENYIEILQKKCSKDIL